MIHYNISISGKHYRLGYRIQAMLKAKELNVTGYVKKIDHDRIYIEVEGQLENTEMFVKWCKLYQCWSRINQVNIESGQFEGYNSFEIYYQAENSMKEGQGNIDLR